MDMSVLINCNCKPFEVCVYIIDGNAHHFQKHHVIHKETDTISNNIKSSTVIIEYRLNQ